MAALGEFPETKTPLNPRITGTLDRGDYRVEKLVFESLPGFYVTANVYVPKTGKPPYPAVLGVAGHSTNGKASSTYQHGWIGMAKRGILVLAYDPPGQGERSEYLDPSTGKSRTGIGVPEHIMAGLQCLLTGGNIARQIGGKLQRSVGRGRCRQSALWSRHDPDGAGNWKRVVGDEIRPAVAALDNEVGRVADGQMTSADKLSEPMSTACPSGTCVQH